MELAAADLEEFVIDEDKPEVGRGIFFLADGGDKEVVKFAVEGGVEWEMKLGSGVEGGSWGIAGFWVGMIVGAIALVGSA